MIKEDHLQPAFEQMEGFTLIVVSMNSHGGITREGDYHFLDGIIAGPMQAESSTLQWGCGSQTSQRLQRGLIDHDHLFFREHDDIHEAPKAPKKKPADRNASARKNKWNDVTGGFYEFKTEKRSVTKKNVRTPILSENRRVAHGSDPRESDAVAFPTSLDQN